MRDHSGWVDQNAVTIHPGENLINYARGQWYHRTFAIGNKAGETLSNFKIAHEGDTAGTYTILLDNVKITNGGVLPRMIYQDGFPSASVQAEGPTTNVAYQTMNRSTSYYTVNGQRVALRKAGFVGDNGLKWMLGDQLGSTSVVANVSGANPATQGYMPWGETRYGSVPTSYQYTGQRLEGIGLYDYGARWYDPYITQFTQPDSIIPDQYNSLDWNRYSYVRYNPLRFNDPSGHMPCNEERGCGEAVDEIQLNLGRSYEGKWDTKSQKEIQEKLDQGLDAITGLASILSDPVDITLTLKDCIEGECSGWELLGLLHLLPASKMDELVDLVKRLDGSKLPVDDALDLATEFLGKDYVDVGNGRFLSADGLRQVRMGDTDILGLHGGGPHINFDLLGPNPAKPGSFTQIFPSIHIFLFGR